MAHSCVVCGASASIKPSYSGYWYCEKDFRSLLEKRVRKDLRTHQPLDIKKKYFLLDDGSPLISLLESFLKAIFKGILKYELVSESKNDALTIIPSCLESDASLLFNQFLEKKDFSLSGIRPFRVLMKEDIVELLKPSSVSCSSHPLLLALEKEQPGSLFNMIKLINKKN